MALDGTFLSLTMILKERRERKGLENEDVSRRAEMI